MRVVLALPIEPYVLHKSIQKYFFVMLFGLWLCPHVHAQNIDVSVGLLEIRVLQHFEQFHLVVHIKRQCPVVHASGSG